MQYAVSSTQWTEDWRLETEDWRLRTGDWKTKSKVRRPKSELTVTRLNGSTI
jgi:hypothetical protein